VADEDGIHVVRAILLYGSAYLLEAPPAGTERVVQDLAVPGARHVHRAVVLDFDEIRIDGLAEDLFDFGGETGDGEPAPVIDR
jgi:hypothetical protein